MKVCLSAIAHRISRRYLEPQTAVESSLAPIAAFTLTSYIGNHDISIKHHVSRSALSGTVPAREVGRNHREPAVPNDHDLRVSPQLRGHASTRRSGAYD